MWLQFAVVCQRFDNLQKLGACKHKGQQVALVNSRAHSSQVIVADGEECGLCAFRNRVSCGV